MKFSTVSASRNDTKNDNPGMEPAYYSYYYHGNYYGDNGKESRYPHYSFERPVYLYIWEILVICSCIVNVAVILVFLSKRMRSATNIILAAIAMSDSLVGLVTLPTYIMIYSLQSPELYSDMEMNDMIYENQYNYSSNSYNYLNSDNMAMNDTINASSKSYFSTSPDYYLYDLYTDLPEYDIMITKNLCNGFMISKHFLSKSLYTISCFLTLFLGVQRFVCVAYPFKTKYVLSERKVLVWCAIIIVVSPVLHSYYFWTKRDIDGTCKWELIENGCGPRCIELWVAFFLHQLIPCATLIVFTIRFVQHLHLGERKLRTMEIKSSQLSRRMRENRRIFIIVTAVIVVYLVPKIPYSIFLLYNAISMTMDRKINMKTNRVLHMSYELLLVVSFHSNFYIYTFLNSSFRKCLFRLFIKPVQRGIGIVSISLQPPKTNNTEVS